MELPVNLSILVDTLRVIVHRGEYLDWDERQMQYDTLGGEVDWWLPDKKADKLPNPAVSLALLEDDDRNQSDLVRIRLLALGDNRTQLLIKEYPSLKGNPPPSEYVQSIIRGMVATVASIPHRPETGGKRDSTQPRKITEEAKGGDGIESTGRFEV